MPRITNQLANESTVYNWMKRDVSKNSSFPSLKPRFRTSDLFSQRWGRLPYRDSLNLAQVYTERSREEHLGQLQTCVQKLPCDRTLQIRWRLDKELPAFSMDFLYMYLSRFGKVEAIYQQAVNACLVLFNQERVARMVSNARALGLPYGRLYTRWWTPMPQDKDQLRVMKHLQTACETQSRFHSLMDEYDREVCRDFLKAGARAMVDGNKFGGPHLSAYLREGVKRVDAMITPSVFTQPKRGNVINIVTSLEEFYDAIKGHKLVVVDFYATWCRPCAVIAPVIEEWAKEFDDVSFVKVDVNDVPEVCDQCSVSAMPTFMFFKNEILLDTVIGALQDNLMKKILELK